MPGHRNIIGIRPKKAGVFFEHASEILISGIVIIAVVLIMLNFNSSSQKKYEAAVLDIKQKSYANNMLFDYLDTDVSSCYNGDAASKYLSGKGNLSFSDIINIMVDAEPKSTSIFTITDIKARFNKADAPYGEISEFWLRCTGKFFDLTSYQLSIYYNGNRDFFSTPSNKMTMLVGKADIPSYYNSRDIISVKAYELRG